MTDMYNTSLNLKALGHVLHYADYIQRVTDDADFPTALINVVSDYLYCLSNQCYQTYLEQERLIASRHRKPDSSVDD